MRAAPSFNSLMRPDVTVLFFLFWWGSCLRVVLCFPASSSSSSTQQAEYSTGWSTVRTSDNSRPIARHEAAFVGIGDEFYLLGGRGIRPVSVYNKNTNQWTQQPAPPQQYHHFQPVVYQSKIYIICGMTGLFPNETPLPSIVTYSPSERKWGVDREIPADRRRGSAGVALHGDTAYVSGGLVDGHNGENKAWLDAVNLKTKQWTRLADAPRPRDHFHAVLLQGRLLFNAGGRVTTARHIFEDTVSVVDVYSLRSNSWSTLPSAGGSRSSNSNGGDDEGDNIVQLPTARAGAAAIGVQGSVVVLGGESIAHLQAHTEVEVLRSHLSLQQTIQQQLLLQQQQEQVPVAQQQPLYWEWGRLPSLPVGRHGTGAVYHAPSHQLFIASGCGKRGGAPELSDLLVLNLTAYHHVLGGGRVGHHKSSINMGRNSGGSGSSNKLGNRLIHHHMGAIPTPHNNNINNIDIPV